MNTEIILSCLVGFIGGFVFAILVGISIIRKFVKVAGVKVFDGDK